MFSCDKFKKLYKLNSTMLGETTYLLKHIENNEGIKVRKLRADIKSGLLKASGKINGAYYVIQSELDYYLKIKDL
jgi:hypothetical protein